MSKRKLSYQSKPIRRIPITLTGKVFLQYLDDEAALQAIKGDLLAFPNNDALNTNRQGEYEATGFSGYFKFDVSDGRDWQPLILTGIFNEHEHHFSKTERPLDVYRLCAEHFQNLAGRVVLRTYREHYELEQ
jgi:hypothetical protein